MTTNCGHEIKKAYKDFLGDPTKLASLISIQNVLEEAKKQMTLDETVFQLGIQAILGILRKCVQQELLFVPSKSQSDALVKVRAWLYAFVEDFLQNNLLSNIKEQSLLKSLAYEAVLALLEIKHEALNGSEEENNQEDSKDLEEHQHQFPMKIFGRLIRTCIENGCIDLLRVTLEQYSDLRFYAYRYFAREIKTGNLKELEQVFGCIQGLPWSFDPEAPKVPNKNLTGKGESEESEHGIDSGSDIEYGSSATETAEDENDKEESVSEGENESEENSDAEDQEQEFVEFKEQLFYLPILKGTSLPAVATEKGHRYEFSQCWMALLTQPAARKGKLAKDILHVLDDRVIPGLTQPVLLLDFLTEAYEEHGWLALASLWILIQEHGLDYPCFYEKLFALLEPAAMSPAFGLFGKKQAQLLTMFLTQSTHFPEHFAAGFAKRLAELAVFAVPTQIQNFYVPLIYMILKKYHGCQDDMLKSDSTDLQDLHDSSVLKPFDNKPSLHEILTLTRHFYTPIADQVKALFVGARHLGKKVEVTYDGKAGYEDLLTQELSHKWSKIPPLAVNIPEKLFDAEDN